MAEETAPTTFAVCSAVSPAGRRCLLNGGHMGAHSHHPDHWFTIEARTAHALAACSGVSDERLQQVVKEGGLARLLETLDRVAEITERGLRGGR